jgi:hypothetical protein
MSRLAAIGTLAAALIAQPVFADAVKASQPIDLVLCLDTSNSMDGLIASAKIKLWDIVNDLAKVQPAPDLRVALYSYGNNGYDEKRGWVRKELDLTRDLDEIYKKLNSLTTNGGQEYVARVCHDALAEQKWSTDAKALRIIFVCGNERAGQDPREKLAEIGGKAKVQNVVINSIFCGPAAHADAQDWKEFASLAGGKFANIDQHRSAVAIATPFDKELGELSTKLNGTYLAFGALAREKAANQSLQDTNALRLSPAAAATRASAKAGALYRNAEWDLVDRCKEDPNFDVSKLSEAELPDEMRKLKPNERAAYIKKKAEERASLQKQITDLSQKRDGFVRDYQKKHPTTAEQAFEAAIRQMLRDQAGVKGVNIP